MMEESKRSWIHFSNQKIDRVDNLVAYSSSVIFVHIQYNYIRMCVWASKVYSVNDSGIEYIRSGYCKGSSLLMCYI